MQLEPKRGLGKNLDFVLKSLDFVERRVFPDGVSWSPAEASSPSPSVTVIRRSPVWRWREDSRSGRPEAFAVPLVRALHAGREHGRASEERPERQANACELDRVAVASRGKGVPAPRGDGVCRGGCRRLLGETRDCVHLVGEDNAERGFGSPMKVGGEAVPWEGRHTLPMAERSPTGPGSTGSWPAFVFNLRPGWGGLG